jgi:hypothetical protein
LSDAFAIRFHSRARHADGDSGWIRESRVDGAHVTVEFEQLRIAQQTQIAGPGFMTAVNIPTFVNGDRARGATIDAQPCRRCCFIFHRARR